MAFRNDPIQRSYYLKKRIRQRMFNKPNNKWVKTSYIYHEQRVRQQNRQMLSQNITQVPSSSADNFDEAYNQMEFDEYPEEMPFYEDSAGF
jgi:hypothetical protein